MCQKRSIVGPTPNSFSASNVNPILRVLICGWLLVIADATLGVCYGRQADNLPTPEQTVQLLQSQGIYKVRLFSPDADALKALSNSQIEVMVGLPTTSIQSLAQSQAASLNWLNNNVVPYLPGTLITSIAVGSEILTTSSSSDVSPFLLAAMQNVYYSLRNLKLDQQIKVSTPHAMGVIANSFPPSSATFDNRFGNQLSGIIDFLSGTGSFFMINAYPYYSYRNSERYTSLDFALLKQTSGGFLDPNTGLQYTNLFHAQIDAVYYALNSANHTDISVVVTETGWPSMGDSGETNIVNIQNAATYNRNLVQLVLAGSGTPFRPGVAVETYIFELFNEDQRPGPTSNRNWGLFRPDGSKFYPINFGGSSGSAGGGFGIIELNRTFCIAAADANFNTLQSNLDWACAQPNVDCRPVQPGGRCYQPDTVASHASYVFNEYFQLNAMSPNACSFSGVSVQTTMDPSYRRCIYTGSLKGSKSEARSTLEHRNILFTSLVVLFCSLVNLY